MKAAWIGLGAMGAPMAGHLAARGALAAAWNRSSERGSAFARTHPDIHMADSPAELAGLAEIIFICVSADDDLKAVIGSIEPALSPGRIIVDHSTVSPATARELAAALAERRIGFVDAPVTGGVEGAKNGQLSVMAGGAAETFEKVRPLIEAYARVAHHLGPAGSGQAAKAVNQLMVAGIAEAVTESLALMERLELPREPMLELLGGGAAGNWFLEKRGRTMLEDSFEAGFDPKLLLKDLRICRDLCAEADFDSAVLPQALRDYAQLIESGDTGRDISALFRIKK